ncbi:MAG TPA: RtcB family protein [Kosmotogaceae bacterium]|nr:MAG: Uncharacterized protein XE05_0215 [Thermotogales bacterium 46_20]HAA85831.1 RtcB family protein [Kosmotogaceae bacterium]
MQFAKDIGFKSWIGIAAIELEAMEQIKNVCSIPNVFKWVAIMPDVHPGFGMPIGGVVAFKDKVIPNAVGVDIGCGVLMVKTDINASEAKDNMQRFLSGALEEIPVGFGKRRRSAASSIWEEVPEDPVIQKERENATLQLGTLGGGNHFIELQKTTDEHVALMVHSGSRHLGKAIADYYNRMARTYLKGRKIDHPPGLAWLPLDSRQASNYCEAMNFCLRYASENRRIITDILLKLMERHFGAFSILERLETIHNYANLETHYKEEVMVHRKGAVRASGKVIIPGSMGTHSYVGLGLENPKSFKSCSHGAGRVMGRKQARESINYDKVMHELSRSGISIVSPDRKSIVEEARETYKNIEEVMVLQKDLVKPLEKLVPLGVIKG